MMRKICAVVMGMFPLLATLNLCAQDVDKTSVIEPYPLTITNTKTTNLIFPYAIKSVDIGSKDVLVQKAIGVENVLQVKSSKPKFQETNLTVITADGCLYAYNLSYSERPSSLSIRFVKSKLTPDPVAVFEEGATNDALQLNTKIVSEKQRTIKSVHDRKNDMVLDLKGLFVSDDIIYFQLSLGNQSALDYDIKMLRFYIKDRKLSKRTASQEIEVKPVFILGNISKVRNNSEQVITVAIPRFTIPDQKVLLIQLMEQNGGRHLQLSVANKILVGASSIN